MKKNFKLIPALLLIFYLASFSGCGINPPTQFPREITPVLVVQGELYGNGQEGIAEQNLVIKMQNEWNSLLESMNSVNDVCESFTETEIDFNNYLVIAVFDEVRGSSGCSISIKSITEYKDSIIVDVQKVVTVNGADVMNQPFYIAKIPVTNKSVVFKSSVLSDTVQNDTCYCIMDTLKGDWIWFKTSYEGLGGTDNQFKSIIRVLSQNEDETINYEVYVDDTLFYNGSFKIQEGNYVLNFTRICSIKLPHYSIQIGDFWLFKFLGKEEICFFSGAIGVMPQPFFHYKKILEE